MYQTNATIKNVNLRTEIAGEERQSAFDVKLELQFTTKLHKILCKGIKKPINLSVLQDCGLASVKYDTEIEGATVEYGQYKISSAKINNAVVNLNTSMTGNIRIQSQINNSHGLAEALNEIANEPITLEIDEETLSVKIIPVQMDLVDDDQSREVAPKPNAENKSPSANKPGKKKVKKPKSSDGSLHVHGDKGVDLTDEQLAARKAEKDALLKQTTKSSEEKPDPVAQRVAEIFKELEKAVLGQGDEQEFKQLKDKIDAGRKLTDYQFDQLAEIHARYTEKPSLASVK